MWSVVTGPCWVRSQGERCFWLPRENMEETWFLPSSREFTCWMFWNACQCLLKQIHTEQHRLWQRNQQPISNSPSTVCQQSFPKFGSAFRQNLGELPRFGGWWDGHPSAHGDSFFLGLPTTWDDRHQSHKIAIKLDGTGAFDAWVARSRRPKPMCTIVGYSGYGSRPMSLGVWECKKSRSTKNSPRFWFQNWLMVKQCQTPNYGVKNNFNFSAAQWTSDSHVIGATSRFSRSIPVGGAKESDRISCWKTRVARLLTAVGSGSEAIFVAALFPNNKWGAKSY